MDKNCDNVSFYGNLAPGPYAPQGEKHEQSGKVHCELKGLCHWIMTLHITPTFIFYLVYSSYFELEQLFILQGKHKINNLVDKLYALTIVQNYHQPKTKEIK